MKRIFTFCLAGSLVLPAVQGFAQTKDKDHKKTETIVIEEDGSGKGNTTIEIKNGEVFIDGKKVTEGLGGDDKDVKIVKKKKLIVNGKEIENSEIELPFELPWDSGEFRSNRPMLGVSTKATGDHTGAEVESIVPNSPAEKLGLQKGDIITRINNKNILDPKDLVDAIADQKPGDAIDITYEREHKLTTKNVVLSEKRDAMVFNGRIPFEEGDMFKLFEGPNARMMELPFNEMMPAQGPKIGVAVEDRADGEGVLVQEVVAGSAAEKAGVQSGDVLTVFNREKISSVDDLLHAIAQSKEKQQVNVEVKRKGELKNLSLEVPKNLKKRNL